MKRADVSDEQVVEAARDFRAHEHGKPIRRDWRGTLFVDELLVVRTGCPLKVAHFAIERAMMRGREPPYLLADAGRAGAARVTRVTK